MKITQLIIAILLSTPMFSQPGALDVTFGDGGKVITRYGGYNVEPTSMQIQSDGKIILSGVGTGESLWDLIAVRYFPNGQLDYGFGISSRFTLSLAEFWEWCSDSAVDKNDNIYLTGSVPKNYKGKSYIVKLNSKGLIDSSFAQNGIWISEGPEVNEEIIEIQIQPDGKLVLAGSTRLMDELDARCTVIRLHPDGTLDTSFGINGTAKAPVPNGYRPKFCKLTEAGEIITGGYLYDGSYIVLAKFNQKGQIDPTFGTNGVLIDYSGYSKFGRDIAIQSDNKILVVTEMTTPSNGTNFGLVRYFSNGAIDLDFGQNGGVSTDFSNRSSFAYSIVLQEDGKIILGGNTLTNEGTVYALARYDANGNLDSSFGDNGKVVTKIGEFNYMNLTSLQSDGKLLCAGKTSTLAGFSSFSIARYLTGTETSTKEISKEITQVKTLPNPSDGHFTVSFTLEKSSAVSMTLFNASGQLVQSVDDQYMMKGPNKLEMPLDHTLGDGMYILKIETVDDYVSQKLVIQR